MDDRSLYATILGITRPWDVVRVQLDDPGKAVHVWLEEEARASFVCPECQAAAPIYDHVERRWRQLDTCQYATYLRARPARPVHGAWREDRRAAVGNPALALHGFVLNVW